jgi:ABC-type oligopeptide transport system substrate-binding subunit
MEGLTSIKSTGSDWKAVPALAAEWEVVSPNEIKFSLRPDVRWSDGQHLKAIHFVNAWRKLLAPETRAPFAYLLFGIVNARAFHEGRLPFSQVGVSIVDDNTLMVRLVGGAANFPLVTGHPATWPTPSSADRETLPGPILGPFSLEKTSPGAFWRYVRNPHYYGTRSALDTIEIRYVPNPSLRIDLYLNGESDLVDDIPDTYLPPIARNPGLTGEPTNEVLSLVFNTARPLLASPNARQAFQSAINPEELVRLVGHNDLPAGQLFPPIAATSVWVPQLPLASAKEMLFPPAVDLPVPPRVSPHPTLAFPKSLISPEVAENIQAQILRSLEIKIELIPVANWEFVPDDYAMYLAPLTSNPLLPLGPFEPFTGSRERAGNVPWGQRNPSHWKNRTFDGWLIKAQAANTSTQWMTALQQAQDLLLTKEAVVIPLAIRTRNVLRRPHVKNLVQSPLELWDFSDATMLTN